jgi:hypothetical protein
MRLAPLLAAMSDVELERLAKEHVRTDERLPRPQLCNFLEGAIRSYRFVNDFILNRQPPAFSLLSLLLDATDYQLPIIGFRERVEAETRRLCDLIDAGELLAREEHLYLYRRTLCEARRSDLDLNSSESALLTVLRQETRIAQVEHFLIEHHRDLRQFWDREGFYAHEENALRSAGLIFIDQERVLIPEDVAPAIWQTLGLDMPSDSARRLFGYLNSSDIAVALDEAGCRTSGSKEDRLERLLAERIQPRAVLRTVSLSTLREICRATDASVSGSKEELLDRVVEHFAQRRDQRVEEPVEVRQPEPRALDRQRFGTLFGALTNQELLDILRRFPDLRSSGTKDVKIDTLWDSQLAESTLLDELMNRQLEDLLQRLGLRLSGSKPQRIERLLQYFGAAHVPELSVQMATAHSPNESDASDDPNVSNNQAQFRQRASSPQASLQPWLNELLKGDGAVRCYATEDPSPVKQLKNKLSQAASARGGLLLLLLADENSYSKARETLVARWMSNDEWPKSVACIALAYPLANPSIRALIEHTANPWALRIKQSLFPTADIHRLTPISRVADSAALQVCVQCGQSGPVSARFCMHCGSAYEKAGADPS